MTGTENEIEQDLKARIAGGDESAFERLFQMYHPRLYGYTLKLVKSREVAEELVMDVFLKLWLGRAEIMTIKNVDGFLFRVAYNSTLDFFRSVANSRRLVELVSDQMEYFSATEDGPYRRMLNKEYMDMLTDAIGLLPPKRRLIYQMSREDQLSHRQIANRLGISQSTVANTIVAAKEFIRSHLMKAITAIAPLISNLF